VPVAGCDEPHRELAGLPRRQHDTRDEPGAGPRSAQTAPSGFTNTSVTAGSRTRGASTPNTAAVCVAARTTGSPARATKPSTGRSCPVRESRPRHPDAPGYDDTGGRAVKDRLKRGAAPIGGNRRRHSNAGLGGIAGVANRDCARMEPSVLQKGDRATDDIRRVTHVFAGSFGGLKGSQNGAVRIGRNDPPHRATTQARPRIDMRLTTSMTSIDSLLHEERHFPPTPEFTANAIAKPALYEAAKADRLAFWADQVPRSAALARALHADPRLDRRPVREVVRRRPDQRRLQLPRPTRRGRQRGSRRAPLGGRTGGQPRHHVCRADGRGEAGGERTREPRRRTG
jgi:hypothetical protein